MNTARTALLAALLALVVGCKPECTPPYCLQENVTDTCNTIQANAELNCRSELLTSDLLIGPTTACQDALVGACSLDDTVALDGFSVSSCLPLGFPFTPPSCANARIATLRCYGDAGTSAACQSALQQQVDLYLIVDAG